MAAQPHCRLAAAALRDEACAARCPFWEPGGAVLDGRCAFETVDIEGRGPLVTELLDLRGRLLELGVDARVDELLSVFRTHLNEDGVA
jgi:hypothetical protein